MLSVEAARELQEAGLAWEPAPGDWVYFGHAGTAAIVHDVAFVCGWAVFETDRGSYSVRSLHEVVWCPRLDQLLQALRERGEFVALDWSEDTWRCYGSASGEALAQGATAEEACAQALLAALRSQSGGATDAQPVAEGRRPTGPWATVERVACLVAVLLFRLGVARRVPLDWTVVLVLTLFVLGFAATAAALVVWLALRLLGIPVVLPASM